NHDSQRIHDEAAVTERTRAECATGLVRAGRQSNVKMVHARLLICAWPAKSSYNRPANSSRSATGCSSGEAAGAPLLKSAARSKEGTPGSSLAPAAPARHGELWPNARSRQNLALPQLTKQLSLKAVPT